MKVKLAALIDESYRLDILWPNSIWIKQGNREWISIETGLLPQPSASLPSFIMMIYGCSLYPDLIFQTHVRCGSLGKAFTINKHTLFTRLILQEAMRLKHLEQDIHLPHTSKYHPDAIDICSSITKYGWSRGASLHKSLSEDERGWGEEWSHTWLHRIEIWYMKSIQK